MRPVRPAAIDLRPCSWRDCVQLERELGVHPVLAQVLVRRGFADPEAAREFIAARERHSPLEFDGIVPAASLILAHVRAGTPITVHGDYDCDGVCSTAVLVRTLRRLGANVDWYLPDRQSDGYGLALQTVERLRSRGTRLLLTAECAITAVEEVAAARAGGIDVVVTDHHAPRADGVLPEALIVHPALSGYPCTDLCATAVTSKLAAVLLAEAGVGTLEDEPDIELVALATVADVVALRGENRRLVRAGLRALAASRNPGLRALMAVARVEPARIDEQALAFRLAPRINAAGRLYRADAGLELLLTEDAERAAALAGELDRANGERRHTETRILFEAEAQVAAMGEQPAYVLAGVGWHPGVIGIVASRIAERHHRPCVMIALPEDGGAGTGSGRSIAAFDLLGGLRQAAGHLLRHGGHRAAAGLQIDPAQVDGFRAAFTEHAAGMLRAVDLEPVVHADAVASGEDAGLELAEELAQLAPFGAGNPAVSLLLPAARFEDPIGFGGDARSDHVRFTVRSGGASARAVLFGGGARLPAVAGEPVDAVFRLELNEWRGAVEPRLLLRHVQPCSPGQIELLGESDDYLARAFAEFDASPAPLASASLRTLVDARGRGVAATIAALVHGDGSVLVLCADAPARRRHLAGRLGGFALCSHAVLARDPSLADRFEHVVLLDPAPGKAAHRRACQGEASRTVHLAWGEPELRFADNTYEREYGIRASLTELYPRLRALGGAAGERLEIALRGAHGYGPELAGRLLRVLAEVGLVTVDRECRSVAMLSPRRVELESSAAFRVYQQQLKDGREFLSRPMALAA
ncbi:MAG: hypothetical protein NVSMB51_06460 [Solirubrobacteraceae bacterium]